MDPLRVLIADDHPMFRGGLRALLAGEPSIEVIGEAETGAEAIELAGRHEPDVVLMDLTMPDTDGIEATRRIAADHPDVAVLVLTMLEDEASLAAAVRAGARGYLLKGADGSEAVRAIQAVAAGELIFGPEVAAPVLGRLREGGEEITASLPELTEREREILELMAQGKANPVIATRVFLTEKTVRNYVSNIFRKLGVDNRVEAVIRAREAGLGRTPRPGDGRGSGSGSGSHRSS